LGIFGGFLVYDFNVQFTALIVENSYFTIIVWDRLTTTIIEGQEEGVIFAPFLPF